MIAPFQLFTNRKVSKKRPIKGKVLQRVGSVLLSLWFSALLNIHAAKNVPDSVNRKPAKLFAVSAAAAS
jgi:hypothetical protein